MRQNGEAEIIDSWLAFASFAKPLLLLAEPACLSHSEMRWFQVSTCALSLSHQPCVFVGKGSASAWGSSLIPHQWLGDYLV